MSVVKVEFNPPLVVDVLDDSLLILGNGDVARGLVVPAASSEDTAQMLSLRRAVEKATEQVQPVQLLPEGRNHQVDGYHRPVLVFVAESPNNPHLQTTSPGFGRGLTFLVHDMQPEIIYLVGNSRTASHPRQFEARAAVRFSR